MIKWKDARRAGDFYADHMSDGMMAYLMVLAAIHAVEPATILAFDEIESHLHPSLLGRVMARLQERAEDGLPVIVTTHSDALLDHLVHPAKAVRICSAETAEGMKIETLDDENLKVWRQKYSMGELRRRGRLDVANGARDPG